MKTREQLIVDCQGLVRALAWQIHCKLPPHVDLEDLVAYGQIGLIEAAQAFDPSRENQFSTYSYYRIRGAILDGLSKMSWFSRASFHSGEYEQSRPAANHEAVPESEPEPIPEPEPSKSPEQLIADCQGLVRSLAWQIHCKLSNKVDLAELIAYGQTGLVDAVRDYSSGEANSFSTHCYQTIQNAIFAGLSKKSWFKQADYYRGTYEQQAGELQDATSRRLDSSRTAHLAETKGVSGLIRVICQSFEGARDQTEMNQSGDPTPIDAAVQLEMVEKLRELIDELPERARVLIRSAYFEGLTLKDAGERLGMSKAWASRLHAKTLDQLAQSFRGSRMAD